jgi:hypothetical protein
MEQVRSVLETLNDLCASINDFKSTYASSARFKSPIIDHYNPEYYEQRAIVGLGKFLATAENEREHVQAVSPLPPLRSLRDTGSLIMS